MTASFVDGVDLLRQAFAEQRPAPCDEFGCSFRADCGAQKLACSAFRWYVESGKSADPRWVYPLRITKLRQPIFTRWPAPSAEIFRAIDDGAEEAVTPEVESV
jgi:hypothetical protein